MHLQTQQKGKIGLVKMGIKVLKSDGIFGLYNGLTASLLRQVTHHNESSDCVTEAAIMCASRCTLSVKVCCICWLLIRVRPVSGISRYSPVLVSIDIGRYLF